VRPGSDVAHLSILGYDPYREYPGRGVFEAAGVGLHVQSGDICFRTNFATVDKNLTVLDRRAGRIESGQAQLEAALQEIRLASNPDVRVLFKVSTEHRGALILRGEGLSPNVSEADPHEEGKRLLEIHPLDSSSESWRTAKLLNELIAESHARLKKIPLNVRREKNGKPPANILILRGASSMPKLLSVNEKFGVRGNVISGGALYRGIGKIVGLLPIHVEGATGGLDSNLNNKVKAALRALKEQDFVFIHMKGTDTAGHDHDAKAKISFIEKIDAAIGSLNEKLDWEETHLAFTGDHCTPIDYGDHTAEPVPLLLVGPAVMPDDVDNLDEKSAQRGGLGRVSGNVLPMLASLNNWLPKFGA
jgi:2,3-bisphosphoglycerate-independent phosphoglycerate mutase